MLETLYSILKQIKGNLTSRSRFSQALNYFEGGVGVYDLCNKNYTTPPPEITLATLRYILSEIPRPFPTNIQALATSVALSVAQDIPDMVLPTGSKPINPDASEAILKYQKRIRQSKPSARLLLDQVGYRVPDVSQAIEDLIIDAHKLAKAKREYESL